MADVPVYNIADIPTKRAIMALGNEVSALQAQLKMMTTRNGVVVNQFGLDTVPTQNSDNAISSGAVFNAVGGSGIVNSDAELDSVYVQGGTTKTAMFGKIYLRRYGRAVSMSMWQSYQPPNRPQFRTNVSDVTISNAASMPASMRPARSVRWMAWCQYSTSADGTSLWGYGPLDIDSTGLIRIRSLYTLAGSRLTTAEYLSNFAVTTMWMV